MFTRKELKLPETPKVPQEAPDLRSEVLSLRALVVALQKDAYDSKQALTQFLRSLNDPGVIGITQATGSFTTLEATTSSTFPSGTWTPADGSGAGLTLTITTATYSLIGDRVFGHVSLTYPVTADGSNAAISGLPFAAATQEVAPLNSGAAAANMRNPVYQCNPIGTGIARHLNVVCRLKAQACPDQGWTP